MGSNKKTSITHSDDQIIELFWQRSELAIKQTDEKYGKYLLSIAKNIVRDENDCEECLSDAYIGAWNSIPPSRPENLQAFLAKLMRNTAINRYKAKMRQKRIVCELSTSLSEIEELVSDTEALDFTAGELSQIISEFTESLSERRMYIFMSRYYLARPIKEIAKLLGCSESTINKEIAAIKCDLREKLKKEGYFI